jgi:hypothetical protein
VIEIQTSQKVTLGLIHCRNEVESNPISSRLTNRGSITGKGENLISSLKWLPTVESTQPPIQRTPIDSSPL